MSIRFIEVSDVNVSEAIKLFEDTFFFVTSYPTLVSYEELRNFLTKYGQSYLVFDNNIQLGLIFIKELEANYVFYRYKLRDEVMNTDRSLEIFQKFLQLTVNKFKNLKRLQTTIYEFDNVDIDFYKNIGLCYEVVKERDVYKGGHFCKSFMYSIVEEDIKNILRRKTYGS